MKASDADGATQVAALSDEEVNARYFDWNEWAYDQQREPAGDWTTWLFMGGRAVARPAPEQSGCGAWQRGGYHPSRWLGRP